MSKPDELERKALYGEGTTLRDVLKLVAVVRAAQPIRARLWHDVALMCSEEQAEVFALADALDALETDE